jgi:4-hydroxy-2-oxoheptanedioate aldolase
VVALMIEKREAVEDLEAILSVKGIDMVVFGAGDYSMSIGKPGAGATPEVQAVRDHVYKTALEMGVQPRVEISTPEEAKPFLEMGIRHFGIGTDLAILYNWWKENAQELGELVAGA